MTIGCGVVPSTFRARIDGAVIRFPGIGDGVARLVEVSMVKVDMALLSNGRPLPPPVAVIARPQRRNFHCCSDVGPGKCATGVDSNGVSDDRSPLLRRLGTGSAARAAARGPY